MIPLATPNLTGKESEYVAEAIASGWVGPEGPFVERFEEMVAEAAGAKWAVATITGSAALHAAATVLGFDSEIEVRVFAEAYPAARNVFESLNCIIGIQPSGGRSHDFASYIPGALVDAAPAIGNAPEANCMAICYSFAANKTVTCGQGGAICGDDDNLKWELRGAINNRTGLYNYCVANLNAAVGCAQMERLAEFREKKRGIWDGYAAAGLPMIDRGPSRWMSTVEYSRDLASKIKSSRLFEYRSEADWGIRLPCSTHLTEEDQDKVIKLCAEFLR